MKILSDLIAHLQGKDHPVHEVLTGAYWTAVVSGGCGLASTFRDEGHPHPRGVKEVGRLTEKSALELAAYALSDYPMEASIGMAAINSLIEVDEKKWIEQNASEILLEKGIGKDVAIIGHFPFTRDLAKKARNLWIFEQNPRPGDLRPEDAKDILPQCDIVGITGTAFINHTIGDLLRWAAGKYILVIGPTTPLSPLLYDYGVHALSGTVVTDKDQAFRHIAQGATFREIRGVRRVTMMRG
ncbi:MAG: DUF364 domain-containing protein [Deltaproteobacteria bacterium]|nr:DUF364 domain-containing protein [Deltaproteobacteria bacterium]